MSIGTRVRTASNRRRLAAAILTTATAIGTGWPAGAQSGRYHGSAPVPSPDGRRIAFVSDRTGSDELCLIDTDGAHEQCVAESAGLQGRPQWSRDGSQVRFAVTTGDSATLYSVAADGQNPHRGPTVPGSRLAWVHEGSLIGAASPGYVSTTLRLFDPSGTLTGEIADPGAAMFNIVVSPDERAIAYTYTSKGQNSQIKIASLTTSDRIFRAVTNFQASEGRPQIPFWSHDGKQLAFQVSELPNAGDPTKHHSDLWIADLITGALRRVGAPDHTYLDEIPSWLPGDQQLAFQSDRTGRFEVWIMNVDGTGARQVTK